MRNKNLSIPIALGFSIPGIIIFLLFIHYFLTNTPVFNVGIDFFIMSGLGLIWVQFIRWVDSRDIFGNPIYHYDTMDDWKKWYYFRKDC